MTWADRLFRLAVGDPKREVVDCLLAIHHRAATQAQRLAATAAQAPTAAAERDLHALATRETELAAATARALQDRGTPPAAVPAPVFNGAARNHWARVVTALDACREARAQLLRATPHLLELDAALADLLHAQLRALDSQVIDLRAMIARADPQALN